MRLLKYLILFIGLSACGQTRAQGGLISFVKKVGTFIDSMSVRGVDRRYIEAPKRPWQLILKGNISQTAVNMRTDGELLGLKYNADMIYLTKGLGRVKLWQGSVGVGYAYNWVLVRGLLINTSIGIRL